MRICFIGAGALGSTIGGTLARGGAEVWLIDPFQEHANAISAHGLRILEGGAENVVRVTACTAASEVGVVADLVIILVKSYHTRDAIRAAAAIIGPQTVVMSLQNGLGHEDILSEEVGRDRVMAGKTYVGGVLLGPGRVRSGQACRGSVIEIFTPAASATAMPSEIAASAQSSSTGSE